MLAEESKWWSKETCSLCPAREAEELSVGKVGVEPGNCGGPGPGEGVGSQGRSLHRAALEGIPLLTCCSVSAGRIMDRSRKGAVEALVSVRRL